MRKASCPAHEKLNGNRELWNIIDKRRRWIEKIIGKMFVREGDALRHIERLSQRIFRRPAILLELAEQCLSVMACVLRLVSRLDQLPRLSFSLGGCSPIVPGAGTARPYEGLGESSARRHAH